MTVNDLDAVFRLAHGPALASLIRLLGDFDLAEEALQEAFAAAIEAWPARPPNDPRAWLVRVARNKAIDQVRRSIAFRARREALETLAWIEGEAAPETDAQIADDLLRLIFTCCHPALSLEAQVALTLRTVLGLPTAAVARAFLLAEETMAQRLVRAKAKIRAARIPYRLPQREVLDERLEGVLACLYLVFTDGYAGDPRRGLAAEAIRLARSLDALLPDRASIKGLLALMLLHDARAPARLDEAGDLVLLEDQDRGLWDAGEIAEGLALVEAALRAPARPSAYLVQAAIAALHARAARAQDVDWPQIVALYALLGRMQPSPVVRLNAAAARAMTAGPAAALREVEALAAEGALDGYLPLLASRAELLRRLGRREAASSAFQEALAIARLEPERRFFARRLAELADAAP